MATRRTRKKPDGLPKKPLQESEVVREEVIEALLQPDRAHHDEVGRTEEPAEHVEHPSSPREQPAYPIDLRTIGE